MCIIAESMHRFDDEVGNRKYLGDLLNKISHRSLVKRIESNAKYRVSFNRITYAQRMINATTVAGRVLPNTFTGANIY